MPYTHPDDASVTLGPAIIQTFFRQTGPYSPLLRDGDQRQVITIKMLLGRPSFQNPQDRGEPSDSEEEGGSSSDREVHSAYGTTQSASPLAHSDGHTLTDADDHRPNRRTLDNIWRDVFGTSPVSPARESDAGQDEWWNANATVQAWGENNEWGTQQKEEGVQMTGTCRCQLSAEQGGPSKEAQVLSHGLSASTSMADQEGARGDITPTVGTDQPADDTHRSHSSDDDSVCSMGLILGR
jgi:hypothetical protein